jgi:hypothetical protein
VKQTRNIEWLDRGGGFFYEHFGGAPVHTLSVSMFLPKSELWFFRDIGYQHGITAVHQTVGTGALANPHQSMRTSTSLFYGSHHKESLRIPVYGSFWVATG